MCKYCECKVDPFMGCRGAIIVDTQYVDCRITKSDNNEYSIYACGDYDGWSEPISYCPFCGRNLKE